MSDKADPFRETDDAARALAKTLLAQARFAALGVLDPGTGAPMVSRIALAPGGPEGSLGLISDLSHHTAALRADPRCSLLIGEPGDKGDALTFPRLTLQARAAFFRHGQPGHADLATQIVAHLPKTQLYIGFADFSVVRFTPVAAFLNGGFGKAYRMTPADLA